VNTLFGWFPPARQSSHKVRQQLTDHAQNTTTHTHSSIPGRALDLAQEVAHARGVQLPAHVVIQADNTCREGRNQWQIMFASWLIRSGLFSSVTLAFYRVGHTHNEVDQRFIVVANALNRAKVLQTPQDRCWNVSRLAGWLVAWLVGLLLVGWLVGW